MTITTRRRRPRSTGSNKHEREREAHEEALRRLAEREIDSSIERRLGQIMAEAPKNSGQLRRGLRKNPRDATPTLSEQAIDKNLAHRARKMAAVPEAQFEGTVGSALHRHDDTTTSHLSPAEVHKLQRSKGALLA